jgi:hypothetical protein
VVPNDKAYNPDINLAVSKSIKKDPDLSSGLNSGGCLRTYDLLKGAMSQVRNG